MLDYRFIIVYCPGNLNTVADALSRSSAISSPLANHDVIKKLYESMGHPGSSRLRAHLLPYHEISVNEILKVTNDCTICPEVKHPVLTTSTWKTDPCNCHLATDIY